MFGFAGDVFHTLTAGVFEDDDWPKPRRYGGPCHHISGMECDNCRPVRQVYIVYCRYCKGRFEDEDYARHYPNCPGRDRERDYGNQRLAG